MGRFSDIRRANQLAAALTALRQYEDTVREPQIGSRAGQEARQDVYLKPFGIDLGGPDERVAVSNGVDSYAILSPFIVAANGAEVSNAIGANEITTVGGFRPARVVWRRAVNKNLIARRSKFTNQQYGTYSNVDRYSCAFGRNLETDNIIDVFNAIKADIKAQGGFEVSQVSLTREVVRFR
ncbi:MAG: hypothetical protein AAFW84_09715 [Cyanobacteria bacterium J06635_15]